MTSTTKPTTAATACGLDGFTKAYYARFERFLDPAVRWPRSAWSFVEPAVIDQAVALLRADLESGSGAAATARSRPNLSSSARFD